MKYIIIVCAVLLSATGVTAQEYRTDVSLRSQIIGGTVPGAQYRSETKTSKSTPDAGKGESVGSLIKNNAEPGKQYKKSNGTSVRKSKTNAAKPANVAVASDKKAENIQPATAPAAAPQNLTQ